MTAARGVKKVHERIVQAGRAFIITEEDDTKILWSDIPEGTLKINPINGMLSVKLKGETTWVPCGLRNDGTLCIAKDSKVNIEVFTIKTADNGDGTFTYYNADGYQRTKLLGKNGCPVFELENGSYIRRRNSVELLINDTLKRTAQSGGLIEIDETHVGLTEKYDAGTEITVQYLVRFNIGNPYPRFFISEREPSNKEYGDFWLDVSYELD